MGTGRKNLKKASEKDAVSLGEGQSVMQVVSLRGSNLIEVMDSKGIKSLALFPAKFQRSFWIKRGNFVIVDGSGMHKALESGNKITCMVSQILFHDQVRNLAKSSDWPAIFRDKAAENSKAQSHLPTAENEDLTSDGDDVDDDLPPLEANTNRSRPVELYSDSDSGSECDVGTI
ncbi:uncharacterized protein A4U43_C08F33390 [Asparagus officinalis]|uniref:probable RNA-binding protein EIF1AD isoform X1 n=1 Tax=Asparagus officinalis TaxID=4686 RepID=UPI00098E7201|nr:probable RNA-binding protein EIF1AD isoform X1 [Asparagus officinalis]XP_020241607.1 probable RNA-binding protein EIF1AD isoform X2 [Asparagus officinalis]ONK61768.1 uncharacterized protein A4U43_C08F33390 [Asparagus officinalis]